MHLYRSQAGHLLIHEQNHFLVQQDWDELINQDHLHQHLLLFASPQNAITIHTKEQLLTKLMPPVGKQEVWAAGVTYLRSRDARMEESKESGGADFYQKVYEAERPELFFKTLPHRVATHGEIVNIREDSSWNVPEPELTLFINSAGSIEAYTIGNDMSSRSIEGENPLYLPQAKVYERSAAIGPCLYIPASTLPPETEISMIITRNHKEMFSGAILLNRMKRTFPELADWLYKACIFPYGCFLMTGTGVVPPDDFTLQVNDVVTIRITGIGELQNRVGEISRTCPAQRS